MMQTSEPWWIEVAVERDLRATFDAQEVKIFRGYIVASEGDLRRRVDFLVEHREWGLFIIEIESGRSPHLLDAFEQAKTHLWDLYDQRRERYHSIPGHVLVFVTGMTREEWQNDSPPADCLVFADELEPDILRTRFKNAPTIMGPNLDEMPARPREALTKEHDIFISYRRTDTAWAAGRIADYLAKEFGDEDIFIDIQSIGLGDDFKEVIRNRIQHTNVLLVIIGEKWLTVARTESGVRRIDEENDYVRWEIALALSEDLKVIPVLIDQAAMPRPEFLPVPIRELAEKNACRVSSEHFHADMQMLAKGIRTYLTSSGGDK